MNDDESYFFRVTEAIFVGWFTLEYLIRFLVAPDKVTRNKHSVSNNRWLCIRVVGVGTTGISIDVFVLGSSNGTYGAVITF